MISLPTRVPNVLATCSASLDLCVSDSRHSGSWCVCTHTLTLSLTPLPQLEGMERPRTKGKEHSYMELEEDENVVEKYTRAMESIANVLQLDQLKQVGWVGGWGRWVGQVDTDVK